MKLSRKSNKIFLYGGLGILLVSFIVRWTGSPAYCFWGLFAVAILLKALFLISVFREKGFRPGLWLYCILAGVVLMMVSMLFKTIFPIPVLHKTLFYGAISLKITGLLFILLSKRKESRK